MPYKLNEAHRDRIPKAKYRVTNWSEYDRGLVQRGDIRFWIDEEVIADWISPWRKAPGRPAALLEQRDRRHADPGLGLSTAFASGGGLCSKSVCANGCRGSISRSHHAGAEAPDGGHRHAHTSAHPKARGHRAG